MSAQEDKDGLDVPVSNPDSQAAGDLTIDDIRWSPASPDVGDTVDVEVDVTENGSGNWVYCHITSPQLIDPVITWGGYIDVGDSTTIDDGDCGSATDGEFLYTEETELNVEVGGFNRDDISGGCGDVNVVGNETDSQEVLVGGRLPADMRINEVIVDPENPTEGDNVEVEVIGEDVSGIDGDIIGYCHVTSQQLSEPVLTNCIVSQGGATFTFDRGSTGTGTDAEFTISEDTTLDIEVGGFGEGVDCVDAPQLGTVTDTRSVTVEAQEPPPPPDTNIGGFTLEEGPCPGTQTDITVSVNNVGGPTSIRVTLENQTTEEQFEQITQIGEGPGASTDVSFNSSIPSGASRVRLEATLEQLVDGQFRQSDRDSTSIDIQDSEVDVVQANGPTSVCRGNQFEITGTIANNSDCTIEARAKVENSFNSEQRIIGPFSMEPGTNRDVTANFTIPDNADRDIRYTVNGQSQSEGSWETNDDAEAEVTPVNPELQVNQVTGTEDLCIGDGVEINTVLANNEICSTEGRIRITNDKNDEEIILGPRTVESQSTVNLDTTTSIPSNTRGGEPVNYKVQAQSRTGDAWVTDDDDSLRVRTGQAEFVATSSTVQEFAQPGETVTGEVTIQNQGNCRGTLRVEANVGDTAETDVPIDDQATYQYEFEMPGAVQNVDVEIILAAEQGAGSVQDSISTQVRPYRTAILDTQAGTLDIIGGFESNVTYRGVAQATDVSGENIEEEDDAAFGLLVSGFFRGVADTNPSDVDIITFQRLNYLSVRTDQSFQFVVDGDIKGRASTFRYNSVANNPLTRPKELPANEHELTVSYGPAARVGTLRASAGIDMQLVQRNLIQELNIGDR